MKKITKLSLLLSLLWTVGSWAFAQSHISTQSHQEAVSMIAPIYGADDLEKSYFSVGKDGFLVKWTSDDQGEHYQISDLEIKLAAVSPNGKEIAVYETDGGSINRISVWNWDTLTRKFKAKQFKDSITSLSYSDKGTYLIVGTATVDGAVFIRSSDGEVLSSKISDSTGIVSYVTTNPTEKTVVMYSPAGNLSYYNLQTGRLIKKIPVMQGLEQVVLFNNYLFMAGVKDNYLYIIYAVPGFSLSGQVLSQVRTDNPLILTSKKDTNFFYIENDNKGSYTMKMLESVENKSVSAPRIIKNYKGPRGSETIVCGTKHGFDVLLGSKAGAIYRANMRPDSEIKNLNLLTMSEYDKILDMAPIGEDFYFLTPKALFQSSYDTGIVKRLGENHGQTGLIPYGDKVILWTKGSRDPVELFDYSKPEIKTLFTPKTTLQSVRMFGDVLIAMESNSVVNTYDFNSKKYTEVYTGAGLQDAVIAADGKLYVAKSYATNPKSSLLCVDLETRETVPLPLKGNVAFAMSPNGNDIYCITIEAENNIKSTKLVKFNTVLKQTTSISSTSTEDADAFTYLKYPVLYSNIGKDNIRSSNLSTNKAFNFRRSASLPIKVCQNASRVVILNKDGSISWYNANLSQVICDWYLTKDGQWYEF